MIALQIFLFVNYNHSPGRVLNRLCGAGLHITRRREKRSSTTNYKPTVIKSQQPGFFVLLTKGAIDGQRQLRSMHKFIAHMNNVAPIVPEDVTGIVILLLLSRKSQLEIIVNRREDEKTSLFFLLRVTFRLNWGRRSPRGLRVTRSHLKRGKKKKLKRFN